MDSEMANLVTEEKVLLAREGEECALPLKRQPTASDEGMSESSDEDIPVAVRAKERVLVSRELVAGQGTGQEDVSMTSSLDSDLGETPYLPRAVILEHRDRISTCHPLLCGK